jgi:hypothetical protein
MSFLLMKKARTALNVSKNAIITALRVFPKAHSNKSAASSIHAIGPQNFLKKAKRD